MSFPDNCGLLNGRLQEIYYNVEGIVWLIELQSILFGYVWLHMHHFKDTDLDTRGMHTPRILLTGFTSGQFDEIEHVLSTSALSAFPLTRIAADPRSDGSLPLIAALAANAEAAQEFRSDACQYSEPPLPPPVVVLPVGDEQSRIVFSNKTAPASSYSQSIICDAVSEGIIQQHIPQSRAAMLPMASCPLPPKAMQLWLMRLLLFYRMNPRHALSAPSITLIEKPGSEHSRHSLQVFADHVRQQVRSQDVVAWLPPASILLLSFGCAVPADCRRLMRRLRSISKDFIDPSWHETRYGSLLNDRPDALMNAAISLVRRGADHAY